MSREIKFRAFYKGEFVYFVIGQPLTEYQQKVYIDLCLQGVKFDQYTGLKDKNGVDIYEADVVKRRVYLVDGNDYIDYNCEIRWSGWSYALYIADKHVWGLDRITAKEVNVIGNITRTQN